MLYAFQPAPFPDADRQRQYEAVRAALAAVPGTAPALLLGNLAAWAGLPLDALLLLPDCLVLLLLVPGTGRLDLPAQPLCPWQLAGHPLPTRAEGPNPLACYQALLPAAQAWVAAQLGRPVAELPPSYGVAVFDAPLTFGPGVERRLAQAVGSDEFALLAGATRLPAQLAACAGPAWLAATELTSWAAYLLAPDPAPAASADEDTPAAYLLHKLRQLWQWLGAADVPADPPYGSPALPPPDQQPTAHLHQLRQELQHELRQQRAEAATREAAYQQELLRLQQQVLQAGSAAGAQQAQAAEVARLAAHTELAARTQELDRRIQQLGQLIGQLQAPPAVVARRPPVPGPRVVARPAANSPERRGLPVAALWWQRRQPAERWALLGVLVLGTGLSTWLLEHRPALAPTRQQAPASRNRAILAAAQPNEGSTPPPVVYVVDSSLAPAAPARPDTTTAPGDNLLRQPEESDLPASPASLLVDTSHVQPASIPAPADSVHPGTSVAP